MQPNGDPEYETGGIRFYATKSVGKSTGQFTQASWPVEDIDATVGELRSRGVTFEEYDLPEWKTVDGIAPFPGWAVLPTSRTARATSSG